MIIDKIKDLQLIARKQKNAIETSLLTVLLSDMLKVGKDNRNSSPTEDECVSILKKSLKTINETLSLDISQENKDKLSLEKTIIEVLLPKQASSEEIQLILTNNISMSKQDFFKVLKESFGQNFDATLANSIYGKR